MLPKLLGHIDLLASLSGLPTDDTEAASLIGRGTDKIVGDPWKYLPGHFNALHAFCLAASQRHTLLVLQWDWPRTSWSAHDQHLRNIAFVHRFTVRRRRPPPRTRRTVPPKARQAVAPQGAGPRTTSP